MTSTFDRPRRFGPLPRLSRWRLIWGGAAVLLLALAVWFLFFRGGGEAEPYRTETVSRGTLTRSVSASGTLAALETVQVGSQLSGQVVEVRVDFNDRVQRGQVLAVLDPQTYQSRIEQAQAALNASRAGVAQQEAGLAQALANVELAEAEYNRQRYLFDRGIAAQAALDQAEASLASARAAVQTARAQISSARANVDQQAASLRANQVERGRTVITAPIDGVVIDRQVEPGQTVASGLNVAVLFTLARDLTRLQAEILVDEADIGQVREGQSVRFTVDAFPEETFSGVVTQIRRLPQTEANVVAYTVVVEADNPGQRLLPGMTANADIILEQRRNVLRVPNSALRFTPADARVNAEAPPRGGRGGGGPGAIPGLGGRSGPRNGGGMAARLAEELELDAAQRRQVEPILQRALAEARRAGPAAEGQGGGRRAAMAQAMNTAFDQIAPLLRPDQLTRLETLRASMAGGGERGVVWVLRDGRPVQVPVRLGASDGTHTEIVGGGLEEGDEVITGGGPRPDPSEAARASGGRGGARVRL